MPTRKPTRKPDPDQTCLLQATLPGIEPAKACKRGTPGCILKHDNTDPPPPPMTYAETLKAQNARVLRGQKKSHFTGD
jgi:hypothetical protein